jgi:uncharacterized membrane protein YtjA (UPF0391 family)
MRIGRQRRVGGYCIQGEKTMLHYAVVFFIIALIAALFGFGGIAAGAVGIAKILFVVFLVLAALTFVANLVRRV